MAGWNEDSLLKLANEAAVREFRGWLALNPNTSKKRKVRQFDLLCDSALLQLELSQSDKVKTTA